MCEDKGLLSKLEGTQTYITTSPSGNDWCPKQPNWANLTRADKKDEKEGKTSMKVVSTKSS